MNRLKNIPPPVIILIYGVILIGVVLLLTGCTTPPPAKIGPPAASFPPPHSPVQKPTLPKPPEIVTWPTPNASLTPGAAVDCTLPRPKDQRDVTAATKDAVRRAYHYTGPPGISNLEFDHRIPFALCGSNDARNIWPEPYDGAPTSTYVHNRKDQLEGVVVRLVYNRKLTLLQAQDLFRGDWRVAWCIYVHSPDVNCSWISPQLRSQTLHRLEKLAPRPMPRAAPTHSTPAPPRPTKVNPPSPAKRIWGWGCTDARAYWQLHGNHQFNFICTGNSSARPQGYTCPTQCTGTPSWTVLINEPCPTAYMNEASNSWTWNTYGNTLGWYTYEVQQGQNEPWSVLHQHGLDPYGYSC